MKIINFFFKIIIAIIGMLSVSCIEKKSNNKYYVAPLIKSAKSFISFANLAYCNKKVIKSLSCPLCSDILNNSYQFQKVLTTKYEKRKFRVVILKSEKNEQIILSFSGPKSTEDPEFFSSIYALNQQKFRSGRIETIFANVYNNMQKKLAEILKNLFNYFEHLKKFKVIFIGHGFGGSLATLAAYDLVDDNIVDRNLNQPLVYAYGSLKIGDEAFTNAVNNKVKVIKIIKNSDMVPFLNNCRWANHKWTCDSNKLASSPFPSIEPEKKSPVDEEKRYYPSTFSMAYASHPLRSSFLEIKESSQTLNNKNNQVGYYYGGANHASYFRHSNDNKFFWNPIGSEILFSRSFKKYQICSVTNSGNGKCQQTFHRFLNIDENSYYFRKQIDSC